MVGKLARHTPFRKFRSGAELDLSKEKRFVLYQALAVGGEPHDVREDLRQARSLLKYHLGRHLQEPRHGPLQE